MLRFTQLAFLITLALPPFHSVGATELQESVQKKLKLKHFIDNIPEDGIRSNLFNLYLYKRYDELAANAIDYYVERNVDFFDEVTDKEEDALTKKGLMVHDMSELVKTSGDVVKKSDYVDVPKQLLAVYQAKNNMKDIIAKYVEKDMEEEANKFLEDENYAKLEDFVLENMNHKGDGTSDALNNLYKSMSVLKYTSKRHNVDYVERHTLPEADQEKRKQLRKVIADFFPKEKQEQAYA